MVSLKLFIISFGRKLLMPFNTLDLRIWTINYFPFALTWLCIAEFSAGKSGSKVEMGFFLVVVVVK